MRRRLRVKTAGWVAIGAFVVAGSSVATAPAATAATVTVTTTADGVPGSLRAAIDTANAAGTPTVIRLASGAEYDLTVCDGGAGQEDADAAGDLDYTGTADLEIDGSQSTIVQTCSRDDHERVLDLSGGATVKLFDMTLTGGHAEVAGSEPDASGGGVSSAGPLILAGMTITGNSASDDGGGIAARDSEVDLTTTTISDNTAGRHGGGLLADSLLGIFSVLLTDNTAGGFGGGAVVHSARLSTTTVSNNHADSGAGGMVVDGDLTVGQSTFSGNTSDGSAGGLLGGDPTGAATIDVTASSFTANTARVDAGAALYGRTVSVTNSTFAGNSATVFGGGLHAAAADAVTLAYDTFAANDAQIGTSLYLGIEADVDGNGPVSLFGTVLADPAGTVSSCVVDHTTLVSEGHNYGTSPAGCPLTDPTDVIDGEDPELGLLDYHTGLTLNFSPLATSPLLDAIPLADPHCSGADQTTNTVRPLFAGCDIGSIEALYPATPHHADDPFVPVGPAPPPPATPADPQLTG